MKQWANLLIKQLQEQYTVRKGGKMRNYLILNGNISTNIKGLL